MGPTFRPQKKRRLAGPVRAAGGMLLPIECLNRFPFARWPRGTKNSSVKNLSRRKASCYCLRIIVIGTVTKLQRCDQKRVC